MNVASGFKNAFGLNSNKEDEPITWQGHSSKKTRVKALLSELVLAIVTFLVFIGL